MKQKPIARYEAITTTNTPDTEYKWEEWEEMRKELKRLYYASNDFEYANRSSILTFISLNNSLRAIPFHNVRAKL